MQILNENTKKELNETNKEISKDTIKDTIKKSDKKSTEKSDELNRKVVKKLLEIYNISINLGSLFDNEFKKNQKIENNKRHKNNEEEFIDEGNKTIEFVKDKLCMSLLDSLLIDTVLDSFPMSDIAKKYFMVNIYSDFLTNDFLSNMKKQGISINSIRDIQETINLLNSFIDNKMTAKMEEVLNRN